MQLGPDEAAHARKSLRLGRGDRVELFDGAGQVAAGLIEALEREMTVRIERRTAVDPPRPRLDLAVAVPKGPRADDLVESLVQLGVDQLTLIRTDRSVVDPRQGKLDRLQRIAIEAAKQSGRAHFMTLQPTTAFDSVVAAADHDCRLFADAPDLAIAGPSPGDPSDRAVQNLHRGGDEPDARTKLRAAASVIVLIGPEGGWTDAERDSARAAGFEPWRFGPHVMRIETAAAAAAAIVRHAAL